MWFIMWLVTQSFEESINKLTVKTVAALKWRQSVRLHSVRHTRQSVCISHTSEDGLFTCFLTPPTPPCCLRFDWMIADKICIKSSGISPAKATPWRSALTMGGSGASRVTGAGKPPTGRVTFQMKEKSLSQILSVCWKWDRLPGKVLLFRFNAYSLTWGMNDRVRNQSKCISLYFPVEWNWGKWKQTLAVCKANVKVHSCTFSAAFQLFGCFFERNMLVF